MLLVFGLLVIFDRTLLYGYELPPFFHPQILIIVAYEQDTLDVMMMMLLVIYLFFDKQRDLIFYRLALMLSVKVIRDTLQTLEP